MAVSLFQFSDSKTGSRRTSAMPYLISIIIYNNGRIRITENSTETQEHRKKVTYADISSKYLPDKL